MNRLTLTMLAAVLLSAPALAADSEKAIEQKLAAALRKAGDKAESLIGDPLKVLELRSAPGAVSLETITTDGGDKALRIAIARQGDTPYANQLVGPASSGVDKGDLVLVIFRARATKTNGESGEALAEVVVERNASPHEKVVEMPVLIGSDWKTHAMASRSGLALKADQLQICLRAGYPPQTVEIADLRIINFRSAVKPQDLPAMSIGYPGREANAAWRAEALARIEKIRKADLEIKVVDADGRPVPGATVEVKMLRQAFPFGSAIATNAIVGEGADSDAYRAKVKQLFNHVVVENNLKWPGWVSQRQRALDAVDWLRDNGVTVRGHCLVWPSWRHIPKDIHPLKDDPKALQKAVIEHITDEVTALKGKLVEFDVINEPYSNHDLMDILGNGVMVDWFKAAHAADPNLKLYINDYSIVSGGGMDRAHQAHYEKTIRFLLDNKAPLHGIGVQSHFGRSLTPPTRVLEILDRFARFGLPIQVTELDIDTDDEQLQADYLRDFMIAAYSHPTIEGIIMWGFWEGRHWRPRAALYRRDWSAKPNAAVWDEWVLKRWRTDASLRSGDGGMCEIRAFFGDFVVTTTHNGMRGQQRVTVSREGSKVVLQVK